MDFLCESSRVLVKKREISLYGGEEAFLTPDEVIDRNDAEDSTERAKRTYRICERLTVEIEKKELKE